VFESFFQSIVGVCEQAPSWPVGVVAAIERTFDFAAREPAQAQLLTVETLSLDPRVARESRESVDRLAGLLAGGRQLNREAAQLPAVTESLLIGAISWALFTYLVHDRSVALSALRAELAQLVLTPFVGVELAAKTVRDRR
jgi:hypothetical protein